MARANDLLIDGFGRVRGHRVDDQRDFRAGLHERITEAIAGLARTRQQYHAGRARLSHRRAAAA